MIIGHHILYGKVVELDLPFVAATKERGGGSAGSGEDETKYQVSAVIKKKIIFKSRPKPIIANVPEKV